MTIQEILKGIKKEFIDYSNELNAKYNTGVTHENVHGLYLSCKLPKMYFTVTPFTIEVHGNTFLIKDDLKKLGFKYNYTCLVSQLKTTDELKEMLNRKAA